MSSLTEIARRAGVSHMTVSKVLNEGYVPRRANAIRRAEMIRRLAAEMGYRPNAFARAMRSGRFNAIAMLVNDREFQSFPVSILHGVGDVLRERGFHLVLEHASQERLERESDALPNILQQAASDGLLLHEVQRFPSRVLEAIHNNRIPAIWLNSKLNTDCVYFDDYAGSREATRRLIALGHRRIAYFTQISTDAPHYSIADRQGGYAAAMIDAGLTPLPFSVARREWYLADGYTPAADLVMAWLRGFEPAQRPTAFVCYDTVGGAAAIAAALRMGLRVPADISVIASGVAHFNTGHSIALARLDHYLFGRASAEAILQKIQDPFRPIEPRVIPIPVLDHQTLAAPPTA
jgi:LacI family transcriptional regulator